MISPQLLERIDNAFGGHDPDPDDRQTVIDAISTGGASTWDELPEAAQAAIVRTEKLPPTSWEDPSQVPGAIPLEK